MKAPLIISAIVAATALGAPPASARNNHTTNFLLGAGAGIVGLGLAESLFSSPDRGGAVSYAPPPVVYSPPPVVYAPPPVYAYPPPYAYAPVCEVYYDAWGRPYQSCH